MRNSMWQFLIGVICGPGAFGATLARRLAELMGVESWTAELRAFLSPTGTFTAVYQLPEGLRHSVHGKSVAVVDDAISTGSSARATIKSLHDAGATTTVVAALMVLGNIGRDHFASIGLPVESLGRRPFGAWAPADCPLCRQGLPLESPV